jgi:hypothetical protein
MIGAGGQILAQPRGDVVRRAVSDHSVDEFVAAGPGDVCVGETQSLPIAHVVTQVEVAVQRCAADGARLFGVGVAHHVVHGGQECVRPDDRASLCGVFGRRVGRVGPGAAFGRQPQHPRPERGEHTLISRYAVFVELVEV